VLETIIDAPNIVKIEKPDTYDEIMTKYSYEIE